MSEIEIRRVLSGDAALFDKIAEDVFDEAVDSEKIAAYLAEFGHHLIVAIHDGVIVGQAAAVVHRHPDKPTELYIDEVGVAAAFQRRGIASRLLDAMFAHGKAIGCEEAWSAASRITLRPAASTNSGGGQATKRPRSSSCTCFGFDTRRGRPPAAGPFLSVRRKPAPAAPGLYPDRPALPS